MKRILIASFDMEVGGVERSLISLLSNFDYEHHEIDLMLYRHTGDFLNLIPPQTNLLAESKAYKTFRMSIREIIQSGNGRIGFARILAKYRARFIQSPEIGYKQMQFMWKYALSFLPEHTKTYDVAISYLWPHYFVAEKVQATTKIAWVHTDFSTVDIDVKMDLPIWQAYDWIIAVSDECKNAFIRKFPSLEAKVEVVENITSPDIVTALAEAESEHAMAQEKRFKLVTVARLSHAKGIDRAIKAFALLKERGYDDLAWFVVGYGGDEAKLQDLIVKNNLQDSFFLLGKQTNPYPYMKAADLYVQPSRYEGKAVTVGEAQILAKPVLITNYPTAQSQVRDRFDGVICEQSIAGIAQGIADLYNDPNQRAELIRNCEQTDYQNSHELEKLYQLI